MGIDEILSNLNEQQKQAVTQTDGYVRVIAGAGSGKTHALTGLATALNRNNLRIKGCHKFFKYRNFYQSSLLQI